MPAYVYLIEEVPHRSESTGPWTKIGYSQNRPEWRMDTNLKRGNPRDIRVAAAFEFSTNDEAWAAEQRAHKEFANCAHQKEWFRVEWKEVAAWLKSQGGILREELPISE